MGKSSVGGRGRRGGGRGVGELPNLEANSPLQEDGLGKEDAAAEGPQHTWEVR